MSVASVCSALTLITMELWLVEVKGKIKTEICLSRAEICLSRTEVCLSQTEICLCQTEICLSRTQICLSQTEICLSDRDMSLSDRDVSLLDGDMSLSDRDMSLSDRDMSLRQRYVSLRQRYANCDDVNMIGEMHLHVCLSVIMQCCILIESAFMNITQRCCTLSTSKINRQGHMLKINRQGISC